MICKIVFCSKFPDIPELSWKKEDGENQQMQSVLLFKQTPKSEAYIGEMYKGVLVFFFFFLDTAPRASEVTKFSLLFF